MKYSIPFILTLCFTVSAQAISLTGKVINSDSQEPVSYATIVLLRNDSSFVTGTQSDEKGKFLLQDIALPGNYLLKVSYIGFADNYIRLEQLNQNMDIGDILLSSTTQELQEVTIQADRIFHRANRQVLMPTLKQKKRSDNGMDLLFNLNLKGIKVDLLQQTISKTGGGKIQIMINGRNVEIQEVITIRPSEVLRIDYYDEPGIRFADDHALSGIIDIILKQQNSGGFIALDATNALTTGFANDQFTAKFNHKKSEFSLLYKLNYRSYKKLRVDQQDTYNYPDKTIIRQMQGFNAPFGYTHHRANLGYNYRNGNSTLFNVTFKNTIKSRHYTDLSNILLSEPFPESNSTETYTFDSYSPSLDIYLQQKISKDQSLYFNIVGTSINSDAERNYWNFQGQDTLSSIWDIIRGDRYSFIGEAVYEKKNTNSGFQVGLKHKQSYTNNKYRQPELTKALMKQSDTYMFAEWNGAFGHLDYAAGLGLSRIWFNDEKDELIKYVFRPLIRLGYSANDYWGLKYVFRIYPRTPSLSHLSNITLTIDDFAKKQGNPRLRTYQNYYNSLNIYYDNDFVSTGISGKYRYARNPIMGEIRYNEDSRYFIYTTNNQKSYKELNIQTEGTWYFPKELGSINTVAGYSNYKSRGNTYNHTLNDFYMYIQLLLQYKKISVSISSMLSRFQDLYGETLSWSEKNTRFALKYKHKALSVGIAILNPFDDDSWKTASQNLSSVVRTSRQVYIDDNTNMVFINFSYSFSFGSKYSAQKKKLNNTDSETGIVVK